MEQEKKRRRSKDLEIVEIIHKKTAKIRLTQNLELQSIDSLKNGLRYTGQRLRNVNT